MKKDRKQCSSAFTSISKTICTLSVVFLIVQNSHSLVVSDNYTLPGTLYESLIIYNNTNPHRAITINLNDKSIYSGSNVGLIIAANQRDITVKNGNKIVSTGNHAVLLHQCSYVNIEDINRINGSTFGIYVNQCNHVRIFDVDAHADNYDAITLYLSTYVNIDAVDANYSGRCGIFDCGLLDDNKHWDTPYGMYNTISHTSADYNSLYGIDIAYSQEAHQTTTHANYSVIGFELWWVTGMAKSCRANNNLIGFNDCRLQKGSLDKNSIVRNTTNGKPSGSLNSASGNTNANFSWDWHKYYPSDLY
ncbi:MAG: hypothetical protein JW915_00250 [Chitinispirillaceae bacterium]|nr:hypothetical protein [Chitinispirillaceae bacterium]